MSKGSSGRSASTLGHWNEGLSSLCPLQAAKTLLDLQQEHEGLRRKHVMQASA